MGKAKKLLPGLLVLLLVLSLVVGGVYSYMFAQTGNTTNQLTPASVSCAVAEEVVSERNEKTSITVENTGTVKAYLRVRLVTYWVNDKNEIVAKPSADLAVNVSSAWVADTTNDTYYYWQPVAAGESTPDLLAEGSVIKLTTEEGYKQVIEVFAEAIQAEGTTDDGNIPAVTAAWGVTLDENGNITDFQTTP